MKLKDKIALITGSAQGIGRAIAIAMAREGANVILTDINEEKLRETYEEDIETIYKNNNSTGCFLRLDVTDEKQVEETIAKVLEQFGRVDILVNNAGVLSSHPIVELEEKEWDRIVDTNLKGTFLVTKWVLKEMMKQRKGQIVNIASNCGITGQKYLSHYVSSKHGVIGFTQTSALEAAEYNVMVNAVCPGPVDTKLHHWDLELQSKIRGIPKEDLLREEIRTIPLRKLAQPEEICRLVVFLASDDNTHITGEAINISGGLEFH